LHEPGVALDLDKAIDTTGVFEFFLLRKNSSRGYAKKTRFESDVDLLSESSSPTPTSPKRLSPLSSPTLPNQEQLFVSASPRTQSDPLPSGYGHDSDRNNGNIQAEFQVIRLRKYRANWSARLIIRSHTLDVTPVDTKRKSLKQNSIPWDYLAGIDMPENQKPHAAHRLLRVFWLPVPSICSGFFEQSVEHRDSICSDDGAHSDAHARAVRYLESAEWKMLKLDARVDVAWSIVERVSELIDRRQSVVRQIFRHSAIGTRSPRLAASTAGLLEPGQWKNRRRRRDTGPGPIRKASERVSRMLSNRRATSD